MAFPGGFCPYYLIILLSGADDFVLAVALPHSDNRISDFYMAFAHMDYIDNINILNSLFKSN